MTKRLGLELKSCSCLSFPRDVAALTLFPEGDSRPFGQVHCMGMIYA
jgi:hypothetical protein